MHYFTDKDLLSPFCCHLTMHTLTPCRAWIHCDHIIGLSWMRWQCFLVLCNSMLCADIMLAIEMSRWCVSWLDFYKSARCVWFSFWVDSRSVGRSLWRTHTGQVFFCAHTLHVLADADQLTSVSRFCRVRCCPVCASEFAGGRFCERAVHERADPVQSIELPQLLSERTNAHTHTPKLWVHQLCAHRQHTTSILLGRVIRNVLASRGAFVGVLTPHTRIIYDSRAVVHVNTRQGAHGNVGT